MDRKWTSSILSNSLHTSTIHLSLLSKVDRPAGISDQRYKEPLRRKGKMKIRFPLPVTTRLRPPILSAIVALTLPACTSPRPLKGGKAITTPKPAGGVEQTLAQGE